MNKINNADKYEVIKVFVNETDHPIAFGNLMKSLMDSGLTEKEAWKEAYAQQPMEMELYYEPEAGLMLVEPGAVESGIIYSPYSGELYKDEDYIAPPTKEEKVEFYDSWGQTHSEICSCLGYDEDDSDDLLMDGYFWDGNVNLWCNSEASGFTERDKEIADYLKND